MMKATCVMALSHASHLCQSRIDVGVLLVCFVCYACMFCDDGGVYICDDLVSQNQGLRTGRFAKLGCNTVKH